MESESHNCWSWVRRFPLAPWGGPQWLAVHLTASKVELLMLPYIYEHHSRDLRTILRCQRCSTPDCMDWVPWKLGLLSSSFMVTHLLLESFQMQWNHGTLECEGWWTIYDFDNIQADSPFVTTIAQIIPITSAFAPTITIICWPLDQLACRSRRHYSLDSLFAFHFIDVFYPQRILIIALS